MSAFTVRWERMQRAAEAALPDGWTVEIDEGGKTGRVIALWERIDEAEAQWEAACPGWHMGTDWRLLRDRAFRAAQIDILPGPYPATREEWLAEFGARDYVISSVVGADAVIGPSTPSAARRPET